jgi:cytochrome c-type biogenesis protein CcmH/NrfG
MKRSTPAWRSRASARAHENVRIDSRLFNDTRTVNFFGTGIEAKWIIAGVVAAGAVAVVATRDKATTTAYQQQQQQQAAQQQQQQQNGGGGGTAPCPVTPTCP